MPRQPAGTKGSPKKSSSLNLVTEFFHYLRGRWSALRGLCVCVCVCVCV